MKMTIDEHVKRDLRIGGVYRAARERYRAAGLFHHNLQHVARDMNRALQIAAEEEGVDYGVLVPAVLLHDIGFCGPDWERLGHDVAGAILAREILIEIGYDAETVEKICHCVEVHKGRNLPRSLEAKILYDADVLEKAGLVYFLFAGKILCEFRETVDDLLKREIKDKKKEVERGFYTAKARQLDNGRLERVCSILMEIEREITGERSDFAVTEEDLWLELPPEITEAGQDGGY